MTMMLIDLFQNLAYGSLSNTNHANRTTGVITPASEPAILKYVNEGLTELHARYVLVEKKLRIQLYTTIAYYYLEPRFAVNYTPSAPGAPDDMPTRYIIDTASVPFTGDVLKVLYAFDEHLHDYYVPINDEEFKHSIMIPRHNVLQIPCEHLGDYVDIVYQAAHKKLALDPSAVIAIPEVLVPALEAFVAHKVFEDMATADGLARSARQRQIYDKICTDVEGRDMVYTSTSWTSSRFNKNGWV